MSTFSTYNTQLTLDGICNDAEGQYLERKGRDIKAPKLANEIVGMLNASGGVVAFGIHDDGTIEDLNQLAPEKLDAYRKITNDLIRPPSNVYLEEIVLSSGELIFLYHVELNSERVFERDGNEAVYLRVADANKGPLSREQVRNLEYNKTTRSFEGELRHDFDPVDLRTVVCEFYRKQMGYEGSFEDLLIKRNLAVRKDGVVIYKNAAILLFAEDPSKYIPNALVRYVRYSGTESKSGEEFNVVKDERLEECIPRSIRFLDDFIHATLRDYYFFNMDEGKFEKIPEYPKEAWLEGIVNALCHRSYNLQGNSIYIKHYDNRLEISNSGPLPAQVTVENIQSERFSRNPLIARTLYEMGYVRELNEGVPRIFSAMSKSMLAKPEYTDVNDTVTLTLRNKVTDHMDTIHEDILDKLEANWNDLNKTQQGLVHYLLENSESTILPMSEQLGLGNQSVMNNLKKLVDLGVIERLSKKIRDKNAVYRFKRK